MDEACLWIGRVVVLGTTLFSVVMLLMILCRKKGARNNLCDYISLEDIKKHHPEMMKCQTCDGDIDVLPSGVAYCKCCNPTTPFHEREFHEMMERHAREDKEYQDTTRTGDKDTTPLCVEGQDVERVRRLLTEAVGHTREQVAEAFVRGGVTFMKGPFREANFTREDRKLLPANDELFAMKLQLDEVKSGRE
jgi:hypothetical protein